MNPLNQLLEYMKIHEVSLLQDLDKIDYVNDHHFYRCKEAEILNTRHLLSVADDILMSSNFDDTHYSGGIH